MNETCRGELAIFEIDLFIFMYSEVSTREPPLVSEDIIDLTKKLTEPRPSTKGAAGKQSSDGISAPYKITLPQRQFLEIQLAIFRDIRGPSMS